MQTTKNPEKQAQKRADNLNWHQITRLLAGNSLTLIERAVFTERLKRYDPRFRDPLVVSGQYR